MKKQILSIIILSSSLFANEVINTNNEITPKIIETNYTLDTCKQCHGYHWEKEALGKSRKIVNMTNEEIKIALSGYKDGSYGGVMKNIMKGHLKDYNEKDLINISNQIKPLVDPYLD